MVTVASPAKRLARRVIKKPLEQAGVLGLLAAAAAAAGMLLLVCAASLGCSAAASSALSYKRRWGLADAATAGTRESGRGNGHGRAVVGECDLFDGEWVWDERYPLYESKDCPFLDTGFRCSENGRPDASYTKWRWRPSRCDLPRFNAKIMLEKLQNRRVVFVGDSIGRNQWESLLCMLSVAVTNKSSIYEVNGSPITKHMGYLIFKFKDYNCTVEYYRSPFIVLQGRAPGGVPENVKYTIRVDAMDWMAARARWKDADVLILNTGHWWNYEKTIRAGSYFQEGDEVKMEMSVSHAYHRSIQTLFDWLRSEVNASKTQVIFRTYAPVHFRGGDWRTGGSCHLETHPDLGPLPSSVPWADLLKPVDAILGNNSRTKLIGLDFLNVTQMTARRKDGHLSVFYLGASGPAPLHRQDCSHWCLPGVPDTWNELLYALFMKRQMMIDQNVSFVGTRILNTDR